MAFGFLKKLVRPLSGGLIHAALPKETSNKLFAIQAAAVPGLGSLGGPGGLGGIGGALGKLGISPGQAVQLGLGGLTAIQGAKQAGKANQINQGVLAQLQAQEAEKGRVRQQLLGRLTGPQAGREDLGSLFASENPFARAVPRPAQTTGQTAPVPQAGSPAASALGVADQLGSPNARRMIEAVMGANRRLRQPQMAPIPRPDLGFDPLAFGDQPLAMPGRGRVQNRIRAVAQ